MKSKKLTLRQKQIIELLISLDTGSGVTIANIAKELEVSTRTVLRELPNIETWLDENDFNFVKKPGVGLLIDENIEGKELILELLEIEHIVKTYTKEERKRIILYELILHREPLKLIYFTSCLKVSEGTLSNDLDEIEEWLQKFGITLIRKQGVGIYLEGEEESYRKVLSEILHSTIGDEEIIGLLKGLNQQQGERNIKQNILRFLDVNVLRIIQEVLSELEHQNNLKLSDSTYIGLVIHLTLTIQRIQNGDHIEMDEEVLKDLQRLPEFKMAETICNHLEESCKVKIPKDECGYITMHIKGSKLALEKFEDDIDLFNLDTRQLTTYLITTVESELGITIKDKSRLNKDLLNHVVPAINRLKMKLSIRNPLLDKIKERYAEIYEACEHACEILKKIAHIDKVPEAEIAYIVMHFAVAIERNSVKEKVAAVIACPTGIGTSKLLASNIEKHFDNIEVKGNISAINIDTEKLKANGIECIISTVELDIDFPNICINPFLLENDRDKLKVFIKEMIRHRMYCPIDRKEVKLNKNSIEFISKIGTTILEVLKTLQVEEIATSSSITQLIEVAGQLFGHTPEEQKAIQEGLTKREEIATTYLPEYNMMFLHCKTAVIKECRFGVLQLTTPLIIGKKRIEAAVVSVVPENSTEADLAIMSYISGEVLADEDFRESIKKEGIAHIESLLETKLKGLYRQQLMKTLEG
nr:BglG family transcription antiterminator [uncultured Cellulosilyticum sp.]